MAQALLVIDVQMEMADTRDAGYAWGNPQADARVADLIAAFRAKGLPVIHVHHHDLREGSSMHPDAPGAAPQPCALPVAGEPVFIKHGPSAFIGTGLESHLRETGTKTLVVAGGEANMCVESTTRMGGNMGFDITVVEDALINFQLTLRDGKVVPPDTVLAVTLANLDGAFAKIATTDQVLAGLTA